MFSQFLWPSDFESLIVLIFCMKYNIYNFDTGENIIVKTCIQSFGCYGKQNNKFKLNR